MLTPFAKKTLSWLSNMSDVRVSDYKAMPQKAREPFMRLSAHLMLARAGFDVSPARAAMDADRALLDSLGVPSTPAPLFSPFQQIARAEVNAAFPHLNTPPSATTQAAPAKAGVTGTTPGRSTAKARIVYEATNEAPARDSETTALEKELLSDLAKHGTPSKAVEAFAQRHSGDNQDVFYPLVAALFRIIGFECRTSRRGVNYDRADAMIVHKEQSIPIEIKSPGEETELSVKAIRQAVENKVILLSRKQFPTLEETTTLAVGYNPPNERSEVRELIDDVFTAYRFSVGAIDIRSLAALALEAARAGKKLSLDGFFTMKGVADASDFLC